VFLLLITKTIYLVLIPDTQQKVDFTIYSEMIKNNVKYEFDALLKKHGNVVLRLPPCHSDFNPVEKV
jgi:hypothetical protein